MNHQQEMPAPSASFLPAKEAARFWSRVDVRGPEDCWDWKCGVNNSGHGFLKVGQRLLGAHRVALMLSGVEIPVGLCVLHSCDRPRCCNPAHLRAGTKKENSADAIERGRTRRGEKHGKSVLTEDVVRQMRARYAAGEAAAAIAASLGLNKNTAYFAISGRSWGHVK
jgi:hypothetical protein